MISNYIEHKGYQGTVEYSAEDNVLFGHVVGIKGLISYEGNGIEELKSDFMDAIDDYLLDCSENGVEPQPPCNGDLGVKICPDLHRRLQIHSRRVNLKPDEVVEAAIRSYIAV